ncbi:hypothetical protein [Reticulibacter mediterranei]|uniref:hypothetical protein n=1 Tax=Reticulibacter mediterranei TaxID=2778369 RepID=UPI001C68E1A9|nr:hypothetical protein [Reticulibacter mediterranei]
MQNKLRFALLLSVLFCSMLFFMATSPQAFASSSISSVTTSSNLLHVMQRPPSNDYTRGYRQGYNDAVYDCSRTSGRVQPKSINDYNRGYTDGYNYARAHDRACTQKPPQRNDYTRGYRQGYNDAVYDCLHQTRRAQLKSVNDYNRGYTDGYNYARAHDRACTRR